MPPADMPTSPPLPLGSMTGNGPDAHLTGRHLLVLSDHLFGDDDASSEVLRSVTGASHVLCTRDVYGSALDAAVRDAAEVTLFCELGIAVATLEPGGVVAAEAAEGIVAIEPERIVRAIGGLSAEYLRGFRDAAGFLHDQAVAAEVGTAAGDHFADTDAATWGLQATGVTATPESGQGVTVAVLDTGLDLEHPDFAGRDIESRSFVKGESVHDGQGHGTHTAGTATGALTPVEGPRYGVAHAARLMIGKVLSDEGSGTDGDILAAMSWAIAANAQVISMSLGADVDEVSTAYETVGSRALAAGSLVIAAAGNNAARSDGNSGFVGIPANSSSIMAVAAVDATLEIADFSARSSTADGGKIDIAGPGVAVRSSWPLPTRYRTISGTSMATPHVAGIAALWAQRTGVTGEALWAELVGSARALPLPAEDVGAGLVQAPQP